MKSILLSFIILAFFFLIFTPSVQTIINTSLLHYSAVVVFIIVVGCAIYFVGVPKAYLKALVEELFKKEDNKNAKK